MLLIQKPVSIAPLVVFRVILGFIFLLAISRTLLYGWVDKFYIQPRFFFHFYGFDWVQPMGAAGMYALFIALWLAALCVVFGFFYRFSILFLFAGFVYTELLDVTHYLNHYYLLSLLSFIMIFLPAHCAYSFDIWRKPCLKTERVPRWTILVLQLQIALVYFYAGIAKLEYDWLFEAQPLQIWLARHSNLPVVGALLSQPFMAYALSWGGALYDLSIAFFLFWSRSRPLAYAAVVVFHTLTWLLFPIGVFPFLMMGVTLIFFAAPFHQKLINVFISIVIWNLSKLKSKFASPNTTAGASIGSKPVAALFLVFFLMQVLLPLRHFLYGNDVLWTEEGFRFSWKVMLIEKQAQARFVVRDAITNKESEINNLDYLTEKQAFMMSSQPDLILQFAHFLKREYENKHGYKQAQVFGDVRVALNGKPSRPLVLPNTDLTQYQDGFFHLPFIIER